nr:unnamed protein product [Digitaria exilis]
MEAAAAKRARASRGSAPDRLSALSNELLCHVFSFLRSRQAVQTTILSKRYDVNWEKMKNFTTNLPMEHSAQLLDAIRLRLGIFDICDHLAPDVDVWV